MGGGQISKMSARELYDMGYTDLVSVIPPGATLSPSAKITPEKRGKCGGRLDADGSRGYNWLAERASADDAARIDQDGASVGLLATRFPAIDIDVRDEHLADLVSKRIEQLLPTGPVRVGQWPKRLYPFRLAEGEEPFSRMQLILGTGEAQHRGDTRQWPAVRH